MSQPPADFDQEFEPPSEHVDPQCFVEPENPELASAQRLGVAMAEADTLLEQGWELRMRYDEDRCMLAADIAMPKGIWRASQRYTVLRVPDDGIGAYAIGRACLLAREAGYPISWDEPIMMGQVMWTLFFAAWRDHYEGPLPHGFPLRARSDAS